jgi:hypothetical protein
MGNNSKWFTDAEIVKTVNAYCAKYPHLDTARSDPKAFTRIAATLPIPQGVSLGTVGQMFALGKGEGLSR